MLINFKELYIEADKIAEKHHNGIFRKGNKIPYIEHPRAVSQLVGDWFDRQVYWDFFVNPKANFLGGNNIFIDAEREQIKWLLKCVAVLHDVLEDKDINGVTYDYNKLIKFNLYVAWGVSYMSRLEGESYLGFILRAKANPLSRYCKLGDLSHNMSNLTPGSLLDKYIMAEYLLTT